MSQLAVLFDLDGTLLDTAPDLAGALNHVLSQHQKATLPYAKIRPQASHGSLALLKLGFEQKELDQQGALLKNELLTFYQANIAHKTTYFPEVEELLHTLQSKNIPYGIVTNKPAQLTDSLLEHFPLLQNGPVVSGDTLKVAKPHPDPLYYAASKLRVKPNRCYYIGDAQRDIEAGNAAQMKTFLAMWGYLSQDDQPETWQSDFKIYHPLQLLKFL